MSLQVVGCERRPVVCLLEAVRQRGEDNTGRNTITNTSYTDGGPNTITNTSPLLRDLMLPAVVSAPPPQSPITLPEGGGREEGAITLLGREEGAITLLGREEGALHESLQVIAGIRLDLTQQPQHLVSFYVVLTYPRHL